MKITDFWKIAITLTITVSAYLSSTVATASELAEEVVTIGSRIKARSATGTPSPVDVISGVELSNQGDTDISNLLRNSVPSYSVNDQPISDAATFMRPANLRGMSPDHTLILINGKRRHRGGVITWNGNGISDGSQGPDISTIPAMALKSVEVLRDGASSIYGSDAIAGVINFQLKDANEGSKIQLRTGQYSAGDGQQTTIAINQGISLGNDGFVNITAEYGNSEATSRSKQRTDAAALHAAGFEDVPNPAMIWGKPEVDDNIKLFLNFGSDLGGGTEMYGYANSASKTVDGGFFYRNPTDKEGVYTKRVTNYVQENGKDKLDKDGKKIIKDDTISLLIADISGNNSGNCARYGYEETADGKKAEKLDPATYQEKLKALKADDKCFHYAEEIHGGFTPRFGGEITDQAFMFGIKGEAKVLGKALGWDISSYYGTSKADFYLKNSLNASLGLEDGKVRRNFDPGYYQQRDTNLNADFTYSTSDILNWAFGAEYRIEEFTIGAGEDASWYEGDLAYKKKADRTYDLDDDGKKQATGFSTSSNGFPGFSPDTAGVFDRANIAAYIEANWDASDDLLVQAALRTEDFSDFGTATTYKLGGNYQLTDSMGMRSTLSTGFKAPTPGQSNASNLSTLISDGKLTNIGVIPVTSQAAEYFEAKSLEPEKSTNITLGMYATVYTAIGEFDITVDYFNIDINDRFSLSKSIVLKSEDIAELEAMHYSGANDMFSVKFFTNDFDTTTDGVDIVISTIINEIDLNFAYNQTNTEVTNHGDAIDEARIKQIEDKTPGTRWNLSANRQLDSLRVLGRLNHYGEWFDDEDEITYDGVYTVDIELGYDLADQSSILFGGNNILNEKGDDSPKADSLGRLHSQFAPMGFNGAFWYAAYSREF